MSKLSQILLNKTKGKIILFIMILLFLTPFFVLANDNECNDYIVKKGDSVIRVLKRNGMTPIFGENGSLNKTILLNPNKDRTSIHSLQIGEILCLPSGQLEIDLNSPPSSSNSIKISGSNLNKNKGVAKKITVTPQYFSDEECNAYVVQKNENLLRILYRNKLIPIYGPRGSLNKTLEMNSKKEPRNKDFFREGETICLPKKLDSEVSDSATVAVNPVEKPSTIKMNNKTEQSVAFKQKSGILTKENKKVTKEESQNEIPVVSNDLNSLKPVKKKKAYELLKEQKEKEEMEKNCDFYTIKPGENLIRILYKNEKLPLYGKDGTLERTKKLNKKNKYISKGLIHAGDTICLPKTVKKAQPEITENEENDILNSKLIKPEPKLNMLMSNLGFHYFRLDSHDSSDNTNASLLSRIVPTFEVGLLQKWTPKIKTHLLYRFNIGQVMQTNNDYKIEQDDLNFSEIQTGVIYQYEPKMYGEFQYIYGDQMVYRAFATRTLGVEKLPTSKFKLLGGYSLYQNSFVNLSGELAYLMILPFNNEIYNTGIGNGFETALSLKINDDSPNHDLGVRLFYSRYFIHIAPTEFTYTNLGLMIDLSWNVPF